MMLECFTFFQTEIFNIDHYDNDDNNNNKYKNNTNEIGTSHYHWS